MRLWYTLFLVLCTGGVFAQDAHGRVFDSAHNYALSPATVAVYKVSDSSLVGCRLSDNFGEFRFSGLPVGIPLRIVVSFSGYQTTSRLFTLLAGGLEFGSINVRRRTGELNEIVISAPPPIRMNGDTLEFNADAFKLDKNAVGEDLLRKLPGVTVWSDGLITVNGRPVSKVLVDGKPFFGDDPRIATQNLPKKVIDKIQVYKTDSKNLRDSTTEMNIQLKAGQHQGRFGKLDAGYGTDKTYESDVSLNLFTPRTHLSVMGAANNINKIPTSATQLMLNSTFKGVGARIDYQPDFSMSGSNKTLAGGLRFQHDDNLDAEYFVTRIDNLTINGSQTLTTLGDSTIDQESRNNTRSTQTVQTFKGTYDLKGPYLAVSFIPSFSLTSADNHNTSSQSSALQGGSPQSSDTATDDAQTRQNVFSLETRLSHTKPVGLRHWDRPGNWDIDDVQSYQHASNDQDLDTRFLSLVNPALDQHIIRHYSTTTDAVGQDLKSVLGNLTPWLWGSTHRIRTALSNEFVFNHQNQDAVVSNRDPVSGKYTPDTYLTNLSRYTVIDEEPSLDFTREYIREFADRFKRSWLAAASVKGDFHHQENSATHVFQDFARGYMRFIPGVSLKYSFERYGQFQNTALLSYSETPGYASVNQLYPLIDSANLYSIEEGNPGLRPSKKRQVALTFTHSNVRTLSYGLDAMASDTRGYFADSALIDQSGTYRNYTINLNGAENWSATGRVSKAFGKSIQLKASLGPDYTRIPGYVLAPGATQPVLNRSSGLDWIGDLGLLYSYRDVFVVDFHEGATRYRSRQIGLNDAVLDNSSTRTVLSASWKATRRWNVSSNVTYTDYTSTGSAATHFTIWNASSGYRFLSGNNLEVKFSALDLLRQNKAIVNTGSNYNLTRGYVNVLQQYFMLTVAWFPRKFGRK